MVTSDHTSRPSPWHRARLLPAIAIGAALLLVAGLFVEIIRTDARQRQVAESALSDYADIASWQYAQRLDLALRNILGSALSGLREAEPGATPDALLAAARESTEQCGCPSIQPERAFRYQNGSVMLSGAPDEEIASTLRRHFSGESAGDTGEARQRYRVDFMTVGGSVAVVGRTYPANDESSVLGFIAPVTDLDTHFEQVFERTRLLPPALLDGADDQDLITLSLEHGDTVLYRSGPAEGSHRGAARLGEQSRWFSGLTVRTVLKPLAEEALLVGGTSPSRLPVLLGLLGVAALLGVVALRQFATRRRLMTMRTETIARVSHELRTPLTQIRLYTEMMQLGRTRTEQERQRAVSVIDRESQRLEHLVHNVLRLGAIERGDEPMTPETIHLAAYLEQVVEEFRPLADHQQVQLQVRVSGDPVVHADRDALRRSLINLLDNAAKHSPKGGTIRLHADVRDDRVRIRMDDEGPGVPPRERERIWSMFDRLGSRTAGSGVGLAVVRLFVEHHQGRISVTDAPDGGARFVIELPAAGEVA